MDKGEWTEIKRGRKSKYFSIERCTKFKAYLIRIAANLKDIYLINKLTWEYRIETFSQPS